MSFNLLNWLPAGYIVGHADAAGIAVGGGDHVGDNDGHGEEAAGETEHLAAPPGEPFLPTRTLCVVPCCENEE